MADPAFAAKRIALLIGNNAYAELPPLSTAVNDVQASKTALEDLGFTVELVENGTKRQISRALANVEGMIEPGDALVLHFAGHGFEIGGQNWLLPVDVPAARQGEAGLVKDESFEAGSLIERLRARGAGTVLAIFDACRDNPFAGGGTRSLGGSRGLAQMEAAGGVFIIFSAGAKQQALDRLNDGDPVKTSVFARSFLPLLGARDLTLIDLAKETQLRVRDLARSVGHEQVPAYYDNVVGRITVTGEVATESAQPRMQAKSEAPPVSSEDTFWRSVERRDDPASYKAYLEEVERGAFSGAYRRLAELRLAAKPAAAAPEPAPVARSQPPSAEPIAAEATGPEIAACDAAAAAPSDRDKPASLPGVDFKSVAGSTAVVACRKAAAIPGAPRRIFFQLGRAYIKLNNARDGAAEYGKAANMGHLVAMHNLAFLLSSGKGVQRDPAAARALYEKAAEGGFVESIFDIAEMYSRGVGTPVNWAKARVYYQKAVELGESRSFANLGNIYLNGRGVRADKTEACRLFREGARLGDKTATTNANRLCR